MSDTPLKQYLVELGAQADDKDVIIGYAHTTKSWHASIGGAFRGSSKDNPIAALRQAMDAFDSYRKRKGYRKAMKIDGPVEERCDHEGNTIKQLHDFLPTTTNPIEAMEIGRRTACLLEGLSTLNEDAEKWPKGDCDVS